ncbi:MAG TPA: hypothetical protein VND19_18540 [Acetobacteraceae bacterium]|nr:hypothetical protein [Acetobacteraceae bacterium]
MTEMTRCDRIGWRNGTACVGLPVLLVLALGARRLPGVLGTGLIDPDSYMRLVRLRETLQLHRPAYIVTRDASGHGTLLHWSHLLDSLVCLLAAPLNLVLGPAAALHLAAVLAGPISIGALGYAIAWAAAPFAGERALLWLGPVLAALSPAISSYGFAGVLHHHVPMLLATVMAGGHAARIITGQAKPGAGLALGAWGAAAIWLTPEVMPLVLLVFGGLWLAWVAEPGRTGISTAIGATGAAFLLVIAAAFAVDPPYAGYGSVELDRLSIFYVGLAVAVMGSAASTILIDRLTTACRWRAPTRIWAAILAGAGCFALWVAAFPIVLRGTGGIVSAADWHAMFGHISEMLPVKTAAGALRYLLTGTLAALLLSWLALRHRSLLLFYLATCAFALVALGWTHVRFAAYSETIAAIMLPIAITQLERLASSWRETSLILARLAAITLFIAVPWAGTLPALSRAAHASEAGVAKSCKVAGLAGMLAPYAGKVVLANVNDTPELLYRTRVLTVGSLYHRGMAAFLRLRAAWRSSPSNSVPPAVAATDASLVLFCPSADRSPLVAGLPPDTLFDRLNRGAVPPWLRQVAADLASGNILYRILR